MDSLPIEILQLICAYVRDSDYDHEDFYSWTLVNHRFYEIAVPLLYETLNVRFSDYESLKHTVTEVEENPYRQRFLIHARRLNLMAIPDISQQGYGSHALSHFEIDRPDDKIRPHDLIPHTFGSPGFFLDRYLTQTLPTSLEYIRAPVFYGFYKEKNWEPLISLIGSMKHLREIHYVLRNMFPRCLLDVIHEHHPTCQLSVWGAQLLKPDEPGLQRRTFPKMPEYDDHFELDLLRSPCLHALSMFYLMDRSRSLDIVVDCIFPLITMAPNLKHIDLSGLAGTEEEITNMNKIWGEYIASNNPHYTATPVSLKFEGTNYNALTVWSKSTNLSSVQAIEIPYYISPADILTQLSIFENLEYLHLDLRIPPMPNPRFETDLRSMFASLKPLKYLRVWCPRDMAVIYEIFAHHGKTLRGFILEPIIPDGQLPEEISGLYPVLKDDDLIEFASRAPMLEELRLPIRRSLGDKTECKLYGALGKFRALRSLILDLDCNPRDSLVRDWNQFSEQTPSLPIRDVFINAAMDKALAKAIWDLIDSSSGGKRLRNLRISVIGLQGLKREDAEVARRLGRSFLISRSISCPGAHLKIREIGKEEIELQTVRQVEYEWGDVLELPRRLQEVISSLWPSRSEEITWDFNWKSFPLQAEDRCKD